MFNASSKHNRLEILLRLNEVGFSEKIRVSINLVRGGIDSNTKLTSSLFDLYNLGCKHIKINELQHSSNLFVSYEKIMNVKLPEPYSQGCNIYLDNYLGMRIVLKRSCFITESSLQATFKDLIKVIYKKFLYKPKNKFLVLYENGMISRTWLKKG